MPVARSLFLALLLLAPPAHALQFEGTFEVIQVDPALTGVAIGSTATGSWVVDETDIWSDFSDGTPGLTTWVTAPATPMSFQLGPYGFADAFTMGIGVDIWDDLSLATPFLTGTFDAWSAIQAIWISGDTSGSTGAPLPATPGHTLTLQLFLGDSTAALVDSGALFFPTDLAPFDFQRLSLNEFTPTGDFIRTLFIADATTLSVLPEPASGTLLLAGLLPLLVRRRR